MSATVPAVTGDPRFDGHWQTRPIVRFDENDLVRIRHHVARVLTTSGGR